MIESHRLKWLSVPSDMAYHVCGRSLEVTFRWVVGSIAKTKLFMCSRQNVSFMTYELKLKKQLSIQHVIQNDATRCEAYSGSKYRLRIFPLQCSGRDFAHARCLPSCNGKPQTPI